MQKSSKNSKHEAFILCFALFFVDLSAGVYSTWLLCTCGMIRLGCAAWLIFTVEIFTMMNMISIQSGRKRDSDLIWCYMSFHRVYFFLSFVDEETHDEQEVSQIGGCFILCILL